MYKLIKSKSGLDEEITATYILQICWALEYIHRMNIIHRDLKPENILIGALGEIKLADFGWANTKINFEYKYYSILDVFFIIF